MRSVERALTILRTFSADSPSLGVSDIARRTNLTTSTAHRLAVTLVEHGLLMRDPETNRYTLGVEVLRLAGIARSTIRLNVIATPVMATLRDKIEETVALHVIDKSMMRQVVHQVESHYSLRRTHRLGVGVPLPLGAPGRMLLAHLPEADVQRALTVQEHAEQPKHRIPIEELASLDSDLNFARMYGYLTSIEEPGRGIATIAAAVRDHSGSVIAALSVSGPSNRFN